MRGKVKWFNEDKGFGFVTGEDGVDAFVHIKAIDDEAALVEGAAVEYETETGPKGLRATAVRLVAMLILAAVCLVCSVPVRASEAGSQPAANMTGNPDVHRDTTNTEMIDFTAMLGSPLMIVIVTGALVQLVKKKAAEIAVLARVPIWCYACVIAGGLTCLATYGLGTLQGAFWPLIVNIIANVLWTLGGYGLLMGLTKTPETAAAGDATRQKSGGGAGWAGLIVLAAAMAASGGCSGMSNGQKYIIAAQTYTTTANTLAVLVRAGEFGTSEKTRIRLLNDTCKDILLAMREDLAAGKTFNLPYMLTQFQTVLDELLRMQLQAEAAKNKKEPTSGPSNTNLDWPDGGLEHGLAAGQGDRGIRATRQAADGIGDRDSDPGGAGGACQPGQRPQWRSPCPAPDPGMTMLMMIGGNPQPAQETEWD